jgi:predicted alpha/beta-fold hydrolase
MALMLSPGRLVAHAWTILPAVGHRLVPRGAPASLPWSTTLEDPRLGRVTLRGSLRDHPDAEACLVVVHGLGGAAEAHYCIHAARAAERARISCLRLCLRGADRSGEDFYHAGLTADLSAAVQSPALARYARLFVLGYSLGGHVVLRFALGGQQEGAERVRAVAAVCAPLDLELSAQALDHDRCWLYRHHVLASLKQIYTEVARRRPVPTPLAQVAAVRRIRDWDALTVVPRFGFESAEQYYATMSVGSRLAELRLPALLVQADADPMVPSWTYERHLQQAHPQLVVHRLAVGGHVGFPARLAFGDAVPAALEQHIMEWLMQHGAHG